MVTVPADTPVTLPDASILAIDGLLLVQVPPVEDSVKVMLAPTQTPVGPPIVPGTGNGFTLILWLATPDPQALVTVYLIFPLPAAIPVTLPDASTEVIAGVVVPQAPPVTDPVKVIEEPTQTLPGPEIVPADGVVITLTV